MRSVRSARHAESRHQQPPSRRSRAVERQSLTPSPRRPRAIARAAPTAQRPRSRHGNRVPRRANVAKRPSTLPCPTAPKPLLSQNHLRCAVCSSPRGRRWSEHMRHSRLDIGAWCAVLLPPAQAIVSPASECRGKNPGGGSGPHLHQFHSMLILRRPLRGPRCPPRRASTGTRRVLTLRGIGVWPGARAPALGAGVLGLSVGERELRRGSWCCVRYISI